MFKSAMVYHMGNFDSTKLVSFGLIQIWECVLSWFIMKPIHDLKLDTRHLHGLEATYPKNVIPMCG